MIGVTATKAHRRTPEPQAERKKKKYFTQCMDIYF